MTLESPSMATQNRRYSFQLLTLETVTTHLCLEQTDKETNRFDSRSMFLFQGLVEKLCPVANGHHKSTLQFVDCSAHTCAIDLS